MKRTLTATAAADACTPPADPHAGQGGRYELDPATGQRRLVHRTQTTQAQPAGAEPAAATQPETPPAQE